MQFMKFISFVFFILFFVLSNKINLFGAQFYEFSTCIDVGIHHHNQDREQLHHSRKVSGLVLLSLFSCGPFGY